MEKGDLFVEKIVKRARKMPNKKWSSEEENKIINFLKENIPFDKPTAREFYEKCINDNGLVADWSIVRNKVRNMRTLYKKVVDWENSTGAGVLNEGETMNELRLKTCPYFDDFEEIFSSNRMQASNILSNVEDTLLDITEGQLLLAESEGETTPCSSTRTSRISDVLVEQRQKGIYSRTCLTDILEIQTDFIQLKRQKMDKQVELKERELSVMEGQLKLQEKTHELQEKKIEIEAQLRREEIQSKERVSMRELELRYSKN